VKLATTFFLALTMFPLAHSQDENQNEKQISLPTSKVLHVPTPGWLGSLNSFPATVALSPDGKFAAFLNDGYGTQKALARQSISILNLGNNEITDFPDDRFPEDAKQSYFIGLSFSSDGAHLYASVGSISDPMGAKRGNLGNGIAVYTFEAGKVTPERFIRIAPQRLAAGNRVARGLRKAPAGTAIPYPAGLAVVSGETGDKLLVANNLSDSVILLDARSGEVSSQFDLGTNKLVPSSFPYGVIASRDGKRAWVSLWNASKLVELNLEKGSVGNWIQLLAPRDPKSPGSHPTALTLSPDERLLYVALSNVDRVAVLSTDHLSVIGTFDTKLPDQKESGTYPTALALSDDGKRLFVAVSSLNAIAVFDTSNISPENTNDRKAMGFIPAEWYPSALAVRGDDLIAATAKGQGSGPNNFPGHTASERRHRENAYIPTLLYGSVARLKISGLEAKLNDYTQQVQRDNLFLSDPGKIDFKSGGNPIKHVIYVLKENRTYDQVLGDLKVGNGDSSLTMYGADITPNQHRLALQFGVLDNFYDSGEVSGDGHIWSNAAITTDYNEKTWQIAYRSNERTYDFGGSVADEFPEDHGIADVDDPATGYMWDNLAQHNVSYRYYGEFITTFWCKEQRRKGSIPKEGTPSPFTSECPRAAIHKGEALPVNVGQPHGSASPWPWAVPLVSHTRATKAALKEHFDPKFPDFNTDYPDQLRADEFLNEFEGFVRARNEGRGTELPGFVLLYLPDDHTHGTAPGHPRPAASVADNDLALGRVVEAVSRSPYWDDTAIFVIEDDAQDAADHVDAHRSIAFVVSKYSPGSKDRPFVDSRFYTTVNMIHTMEALLGLPPMNQNDAYAPVMAPLFSGPGNQPPYSADSSNLENGLIYQMNPAKGRGAEESEKMDFSRPDAANAATLNRVLWRDRKGDVPMPAPRHGVLPAEYKTGRDKNERGD
jgi:DNA-binding beta-propeller fold protein YncE